MGDEPMDAAEVPDKGKGKMALQDDPMEASEEEESSEDEEVSFTVRERRLLSRLTSLSSARTMRMVSESDYPP